MAAKLYSLLSKSLAFSALIALSLNISSCEKKSNADDAKKFVATWKGVGICGGVVKGEGTVMETITLSAGSDGVTATLPITTGLNSCLKESKVTGTANEDILTFPKQTVADGCGRTYQVSGFASIIGDSISITINAEGADSSGICNFRGKKS
jgi:hypothetical protein